MLIKTLLLVFCVGLYNNAKAGELVERKRLLKESIVKCVVQGCTDQCTLDSMVDHMVQKHGIKFACKECSSSYAYAKNLRQHIKNNHKSEVVCVRDVKIDSHDILKECPTCKREVLSKFHKDILGFIAGRIATTCTRPVVTVPAPTLAERVARDVELLRPAIEEWRKRKRENEPNATRAKVRSV